MGIVLQIVGDVYRVAVDDERSATRVRVNRWHVRLVTSVHLYAKLKLCRCLPTGLVASTLLRCVNLHTPQDIILMRSAWSLFACGGSLLLVHGPNCAPCGGPQLYTSISALLIHHHSRTSSTIILGPRAVIGVRRLRRSRYPWSSLNDKSY
eukprot:1264120-Pyramimonas_sp.AAC.1